MIWVVWRQHRAEGLITLSVLGLLATFLLLTGLDMAQTSQQLGMANCLAHAANPNEICGPLVQAFLSQFGVLNGLTLWPSVLLVLLGILVGAPLVARELEQGTHRLVWTQSITRARWLTTKLTLVLGAGLLVAGGLMGLLIWWSSTFVQFQGRFSPATFDFSGPVWLAAALLALTLGIFAGTLTHRTVLGMFLTIVLFLSIRLPVELFWRPHFEPAITVTWSLEQQNSPVRLSTQDWFISNGWLDAKGNQFSGIQCSQNETTTQCLQAKGAINYVTYQPADRFWTFQWIETSIYLAFALVALGATFFLVKRRLN